MKSSVHGLLVIDKPLGITSRDAVNRAQGWFPGTRIGHTGTLDPLATGVLVLCLGVATRLAEYVQEQGKVYCTRIRLGARSDSDDAEGVITPVEAEHVPETAVTHVLEELTGWIEQVPPAFSAVKVAGRRAYALARSGRGPALKARRVLVERIERLEYAYPWLELQVCCGEGTYIRALARDIGARLGCGGYVASLRRLRVGRFGIEDALSLDAPVEAARAKLLPPAAAFDGPALTLDHAHTQKLRQGQRVEIPRDDGRIAAGERCAVLDELGRLVAICRAEAGGEALVLRPVKVVPSF